MWNKNKLLIKVSLSMKFWLTFPLYIAEFKKNHPYDKNIKMQNIFQNVLT